MLTYARNWIQENRVFAAGLLCYYIIAVPTVWYMHNKENKENPMKAELPKEPSALQKATADDGIEDRLMIRDTSTVASRVNLRALRENERGPGPDEPLEYVLDIPFMTGKARLATKEE